MILNEMYTLSNEVKIPKLGLGTWFIPDDKAAQAVCDAVKLGYRHFDTAQAYENERGVGEGIRTCGISREELFVTTKLAAEAKTYQEAVAAIDGSLKAMGLDYIDMMLIHSPSLGPSFGKKTAMRKETGRHGARWRKRTKQGSCGPSAFPTLKNRILTACWKEAALLRW